jgi:anti-anti-sigma factor
MTSGWPTSDPDPFSIESTDSGAWWCRMTLSGVFDMAGAPQFRQAVDGALSRGRQHIAVDTSAVTFMDSSGLSAVLAARADVLAAEGTFRLTAVSAQVARILDMAALTDALLDKRQGT